MINRIVFVGMLLSLLSGCANGSFKGKVVSCADQSPIPDAKLERETSGPAGNNNVGLFPGATDKKGAYSALAGVPEGTVVTLKVQKEGFQPKQEKLTPNVEQTICLEPEKK